MYFIFHKREYLVVAKCNSFVAKIYELRQDVVKKELPHGDSSFLR